MRKSKTRQLVSEAFREVTGNVPARVKQTKRTKGAGAARKQQIAIALSKARKAGARIPKK
jgi:hypothetical protein